MTLNAKIGSFMDFLAISGCDTVYIVHKVINSFTIKITVLLRKKPIMVSVKILQSKIIIKRLHQGQTGKCHDIQPFSSLLGLVVIVIR